MSFCHYLGNLTVDIILLSISIPMYFKGVRNLEMLRKKENKRPSMSKRNQEDPVIMEKVDQIAQ